MTYYRIKATSEVLDFEPTTENPDNIERLTNKAGKAAFMAQARAEYAEYIAYMKENGAETIPWCDFFHDWRIERNLP